VIEDRGGQRPPPAPGDAGEQIPGGFVGSTRGTTGSKYYDPSVTEENEPSSVVPLQIR
jgi:hypothetical protein